MAFQGAYDQVRAQELAYKNSEAYQSSIVSSIATKTIEHSSTSNDEIEILEVVKASTLFHKYYTALLFCGKHRNPRNLCPAKDAICYFCQKSGHFASVYQKRIKNRQKSLSGK